MEQENETRFQSCRLFIVLIEFAALSEGMMFKYYSYLPLLVLHSLIFFVIMEMFYSDIPCCQWANTSLQLHMR